MVHFLGGKSVKHVGEKVQLCRGNVSKLCRGNVLRVSDTQPLKHQGHSCNISNAQNFVGKN